jgi:2-keto-4-pentenoate hydratase/2-oxohepta-3-ene-1,7-dioic acid hydratase in catechol pathway
MRIGTIAGRSVIISRDRAIDVGTVSGGRFGPEPFRVFDEWSEFIGWVTDLDLDRAPCVRFVEQQLEAPSPEPRQVFAIGLNYSEHAAEAGVSPPEGLEVPPTFTKFRSSLSGPFTILTLPSLSVDWEVELVAVIGASADGVSAEDAWGHVAGLTVGQDFSERDIQRLGPVPQFSMAKSFPGFGPTGPWLVTPDEFPDPTDLELECLINGEIVQKTRTTAMIVPVAGLIARLSAVCSLFPGDVIFTGTPSGVGAARTPERYLKAGDEIVSRVRGIGELRQVCVGPDDVASN